MNVVDTTDLFTLEKLKALAERLKSDFLEAGQIEDYEAADITLGFVQALIDGINKSVMSSDLMSLLDDKEEGE